MLPSSPTVAAPPADENKEVLQLESLRETLQEKSGEGFWRSLDELAETEEFRDLMHREFPREAAEWDSSVSRRRFLQVAAAGLALAGMTGCTRQPEERIVPHVRMSDYVVPGKPLYYASAAPAGGYVNGVLVESNEGRPTKVEGNRDHPWSLGATDNFTQASTLQLYDPDRSRFPLHLGKSVLWSTIETTLQNIARAQEPLGGADLAFISSAASSPTLEAQLAELRERFPQARWVEWEAAGREVVHQGLEQVYGQSVEVSYDLSGADVILTLEADLFHEDPGSLRYARQFAKRRRVHEGDSTMNRLYSVESTPTPTGTLADHRLVLRASAVGTFTAALAERLGVPGAAGSGAGGENEEWLQAVADDLLAHRGRSLVVAGSQTSPELVALAQAINHHLGNVDATVRYTDLPLVRPEGPGGAGVEALRELVEGINAGSVRTLFFLDTNPVLDAPVDLGLVDALAKVETCIHLGQYVDETARYCHWHINQAHYLEGWSDGRAIDGTTSVVQPLIEPLFDGKTVHEVLGTVLGQVGTAYQLVESYWRQQLGDAFDDSWPAILHNGVVPDSQFPSVSVSPVGSALTAAGSQLRAIAGAAPDLELSFRPDSSVWDGRFANNAWLQEAPRPLSKLTWDNALLVAPATVARLELADKPKWSPFPDQLHGEKAKAAQLLTATGKMVRVKVGSGTIELPLWVHPGQAEGTVTVNLGYGREYGGAVAKGAGFNVYPIRTSDTQWLSPSVTLETTGKRYQLASTQRNANIVLEGQEAKNRHLVRTATISAYNKDPKLIESMGHAEMQEISFYPGYAYDGIAWGMAVDLSSCTGCNACVIACQAENNIPTVGKDQISRGREMHWLRIDRYYEGSIDNPRIHSQPISCMQCEQAPCEVVCPVAATVHSEEGLNDMVYNRCVGTRYCSNNCPYKVRRFNFLRYSNDESDPLVAMSRNPDVTVRTRGVMEKCTYCVQRIKEARSEARVDANEPGRKINEDDLLTACQEVCATDAIAFGDINDENSRVAKWKATNLNYSLLEELGTRPRTTYLAKLRNPNPVLEPEEADHHGSH
ncbi:MAG: TAT-variant-translocated molybdopterin oxidoreductase [Acidobacteriota bacterium]